MDERERESEDERESNVSGIIMDAFCGGFGVALLLLQLDASPHIILLGRRTGRPVAFLLVYPFARTKRQAA